MIPYSHRPSLANNQTSTRPISPQNNLLNQHQNLYKDINMLRVQSKYSTKTP